jgi:NAD(P)H-hydrate repair Nnr-like enzyme with NAD(P)H-hydrate dehydratase domain
MKQGMQGALKLLLETAKAPFVMDADALNIFSDSPELLKMVPPNSVLTPHPGEI